MILNRKKFIAWLFEISQRFYTQHFKKKKQAWNVTKELLLSYPEESFGYHLGLFLQKNGFELIPKVERHDAYHVLTGYGTQAEDEVALQYVCFGNGKRTPYSLAVILVGSIILPEYLPYYIRSFKRGKKANHFHDYDYSKLLTIPLEEMRAMVFSEKKFSKIL